jgi:hypothetical protein
MAQKHKADESAFYDFDIDWSRVRGTRKCNVMGHTYKGMKDLPFQYAVRLDNVRDEGDDGQSLFKAVIDHCFGEGVYAEWVDEGISSEQILDVLLFVKCGYDAETMKRYREAQADLKNLPLPQAAAATKEEEIVDSLSASTGISSTPTSDASTAST